MRSVYIISFDLSVPGVNLERVIEKIKENVAWARIGSTAYIVISEKSPAEVRNAITPTLSQKDKLIVSSIKAPAAWVGLTDEVSEWIKKNLT